VGQVSVETRRVLKELAEPVKREASEYQAMLDLMTGLDMQQAISNRREIWNLQT
jgi:hypothetical protein